MSLTSALVSGGSSLLNTGLNSIFANSANSKAKNQLLTQFWMQNYFMNKQNEYNKPVNQMKRLKEAGLNPHLVYGNGATTLSAGPSGGGQAKVTPTQVSDFDALQALIADKQLTKFDADIENTEFQTKNIANQIYIDQKNLELREALIGAQVFNLMMSGQRTKYDNDFYQYLNSLMDDGVSGGAGLSAFKSAVSLARIFAGRR